MAGPAGWPAPSTAAHSTDARWASQPSTPSGTPSSSASAFGLGRPASSLPLGLEDYPLFARAQRRGSLLSTELPARPPRAGNDSGEVSDDLLGTLDDDEEMDGVEDEDVPSGEALPPADGRRLSQSSVGSHSNPAPSAWRPDRPVLGVSMSTYRLAARPSPPLSAISLPTFNPLNPRAESSRGSGEHGEGGGSLGSDVAMQLDRTGADSPGFVGGLPSSPMMLQRARSSPQLQHDHPITPPSLTQRRFGTTDDVPVSPNGTPVSPASSTAGKPVSGPVRRPIARRANLLPKPKQHLRVAAQMRDETSAVGDLEASSEAAIFRMRKAESSLPAALGVAPGQRSVSAPTLGSAARPTLNNRFPESAGDDDDRRPSGGPDSSGSDDDGTGAGSDVMSRGGGGDGMALDEEMTGSPFEDPAVGSESDPGGVASRKNASLWSQFREPRPSPRGGEYDVRVAVPAARLTDQHMPSTPAWGSSSDRRPNKRKADEGSSRFEPYSSLAFKRRAVSPTASSLAGSPVLPTHAGTSAASQWPTPPPGPAFPLGSAAAFASALRSGSPSPAAAGITFPAALAGFGFANHDEKTESAGDTLQSMSLG